MISNNFKLIIFSIILGTLTLIYNNGYDGLYKNINYKNVVLVPTNFRSLAELLHELRTNHIHENNELREYQKTNKSNYLKSKYPNYDAKPKRNITKVIEKENVGKQKLKKYRKGIYDNEKETKSNISSRSIKHLEMERKLYISFYVKPEIYFEKFSDKSNDKSCECAYKKKLYDKLSSLNKAHDNYLDNLKSGCAGGVGVCVLSSTFTKIAGATAAAKSLFTGITSSEGVSKFIEAFICANLFSKPATQAAISSVTETVKNITLPSSFTAETAAGTVSGVFLPYGIAIYVIISIIVLLIILYIWLRKRRKNSWKHEYKKHLCT
ncbi:hypothetical protein PFAG_06129 [Plasmodium falciparum Santa Lucia]|uniref:Surface antigen n=1 Tax=Plasmodium falciparum Santa Lucia TaxID=478859 RepID=W7FFM4_PLAFA|nr:hypothetical protein PFAG_06129 [Plasmodium falciparum Santa Lucia]